MWNATSDVQSVKVLSENCVMCFYVVVINERFNVRYGQLMSKLLSY